MKKYNQRVVKKIVDLFKSDTYTVAEICESVRIGKRTYYDWMLQYPDFKEAIENAREEFNEKIIIEARHSLRKKVNGYTVRETKVVTVPGTAKDANGMPTPVIKEQSVNERHIAPDTAAIIFTLTNGDPEHWKNRQNNEVTGAGGKNLLDNKSIEDLKVELNGLMKIVNDKPDE
jgi:hypothetical protein